MEAVTIYITFWTAFQYEYSSCQINDHYQVSPPHLRNDRFPPSLPSLSLCPVLKKTLWCWVKGVPVPLGGGGWCDDGGGGGI